MAVMDEFKEEREALKNAGFKKRASYFIYYYKWYVIVAVLVLIAVISFIYQLATKKENAFYAVFMNSVESEEAAQRFQQNFNEYAGIDTQEFETVFDTSITIDEDNSMMADVTMTSTQKLMVYVAAAEIDVLLSDSASIEKYANSSSFYDMREILTEEQLSRYEPYFYYVDMAVVRELEEAQDNLDTEYQAVFPAPKKPEEMEEPVPVGLYVDSTKLEDAYYFPEGELVLGVYANAPHLEQTLKFIDYLFEA